MTACANCQEMLKCARGLYARHPLSGPRPRNTRSVRCGADVLPIIGNAVRSRPGGLNLSQLIEGAERQTENVWSRIRLCGIMSRMTLERWERWTDWPLTVAAVIFLGAYAWPILDLQLTPAVVTVCSVVSLTLWAAFGLDYAVRVCLAERRLHFVGHHLPDLGMILLPVLRPLRALRAVLALSRVSRRASLSLRGHAIVYVAGALPLIVFVAAVAALGAERGANGSNITDFGDAVWWACTTISTVGYGDRYPVTGEGRLIAVGLMLSGIALLGVVTAALASWFVERLEAVEETGRETHDEVGMLLHEVRSLRAELENFRPASSGSDK